MGFEFSISYMVKSEDGLNQTKFIEIIDNLKSLKDPPPLFKLLESTNGLDFRFGFILDTNKVRDWDWDGYLNISARNAFLIFNIGTGVERKEVCKFIEEVFAKSDVLISFEEE